MDESRDRALVVDDDALNRMILTAAVEGLGFEVETAEGGREALERLEQVGGAPLHVVLLDLMMPGLDGFGVLSALGGNARLRELPVIVVSGLEEMDAVVRCLEAGAADFLPKPVDPVLLKTRLETSLASRRLAAERDETARLTRRLESRDRLLERTYRRPLTDEDVDSLLADRAPR